LVRESRWVPLLCLHRLVFFDGRLYGVPLFFFFAPGFSGGNQMKNLSFHGFLRFCLFRLSPLDGSVRCGLGVASIFFPFRSRCSTPPDPWSHPLVLRIWKKTSRTLMVALLTTKPLPSRLIFATFLNVCSFFPELGMLHGPFSPSLTLPTPS